MICVKRTLINTHNTHTQAHNNDVFNLAKLTNSRKEAEAKHSYVETFKEIENCEQIEVLV